MFTSEALNNERDFKYQNKSNFKNDEQNRKKQPKNIQQSQIYANSIFVVWLLLCASLNGYQCKWCICLWSSHITFHHIFSHKIKYSRNKNVDFNISTKDLPFFILCFFHPWCLEFSDSQMYEYCKWSTKFRMNRRTKKWSAYCERTILWMVFTK